jgi:hypothetical protein
MFAVGILPALLSILVMLRLKEPERWRKAVAEGVGKRKAGSLKELFGQPRWRRRAIVGMLLGSAGVIGLWGIGFFSIDLTQSIFQDVYEQEARKDKQADNDRQLIYLAVRSPEALQLAEKIRPQYLLSLDPANKDPQRLLSAALALQGAGQRVSVERVLDALDSGIADQPPQSPEERERRAEYLSSLAPPREPPSVYVDRILTRYKKISGDAGWWGNITSMLFNVGAFFGVYVFTRVTQRIGRRQAFAIAFVAAMVSTAVAFLYMKSRIDVYWMVPLMGFCELALFGGYAIYFPELFPTRLRSTGTSLCYNIARYVAASGMAVRAVLIDVVFRGSEHAVRYAGVTMCSVFLLGLLVLPFAPETKDEPLPE